MSPTWHSLSVRSVHRPTLSFWTVLSVRTFLSMWTDFAHLCMQNAKYPVFSTEVWSHETSCHCWSKIKNKRRHFSSFAPERKSGRRIWAKTSTNIREVMQIVSEWGHWSNLDGDTSPLSPLQTFWYGGSKCSLNKETGKRRKWHGFYFQTKIPHRPPTHCLTLFLSLSPSPRSPLCLVAFSTKCRRWGVRSSHGATVRCFELGELGQSARELDQVVMENKGRWGVVGLRVSWWEWN